MSALYFYHDQEHSHKHEHGGGRVHSHGNSDSHGGRGHGCSNRGSDSQDESLALLQYLLNHNVHHAEELHDLAHNFEGAGAEALHKAVASYGLGNQQLKEALLILKGE